MQQDFTIKPCFPQKERDQHELHLLLFCLRAKKNEAASFSALGFTKRLKSGWLEISVSLDMRGLGR